MDELTPGGPRTTGSAVTSTRPEASLLSRREALRAGALAGGAIALGLALPASAGAQEGEDLAGYISGLIELEQAAVLAYGEGAAAERISAEAVSAFERFGAQEQAHANALRKAFETISTDEAPEPPTSAEDSELLDGLGSLQGTKAWLEFLIGLEQDQVNAYLERIADVESRDLVRTSAEIVACQAQHQAVLRQLAGDQPAQAVPDALVAPAAGAAAGE